MATVTILSDGGMSTSEMLHHLERFLTAQNTAETISVDCLARLKNMRESLSVDTAQTHTVIVPPIDLPKS